MKTFPYSFNEDGEHGISEPRSRKWSKGMKLWGIIRLIIKQL
jgi:hypothetical protein